MTYGDFQNLPGRTTFDEVLHDTEFKNGNNPKYDGYEKVFASMVYKCLNKKLRYASNKSASTRGKNLLPTQGQKWILKTGF